VDHLGPITHTLDRLINLSPKRSLRVTPNWIQHRIRSNWKLIAENLTDGYHVNVTHRSIMDVAGMPGSQFGERSLSRVHAFTNGHVEIDHRPRGRASGERLGWLGHDTDFPEYVSAMIAAHGETPANQLMTDGPPTLFIFPNLFIANFMLLRIHPESPTESIVESTLLLPEGADELNPSLRRKMQSINGPAGLVFRDDVELFERCQSALQNRWPDEATLLLDRGLERESTPTPGTTRGNLTDETSQRAFWNAYAGYIQAEGET
jgi:phenylpropionate dioxygenase-like ring-hydroxylating dioxygenase large terminal subunit